MSHSCNFINWMSATRRRASSVTPVPNQQQQQQSAAQADLTSKDDGSRDNATSVTSTICAGQQPQVQSQTGRRASSSDEIARLEPAEPALLTGIRSVSGNHLAIGASVETICGSNQTQTNAVNKSTPRNSMSVQPLEIEIDSPQMEQLVSPFSVSSHPVSLDDILKIDMDNLKFEEECKALEAEAQYWEQKVESLERQQFAEDVPRTLVDSIIKHRKELRDLEHEIYKRTLDSEESDVLSCEGKLSQNINWLDDTSPSDVQSPMSNKYLDSRLYYNGERVGDQLVDDMDESLHIGENAKPCNKFASQLRPGQENTADVLNAVPPPSSLQRRQYLNKASSGTDTSEYSQMPLFNQHSHKIVRHHQISYQPEEAHVAEEDGRLHHHRQRLHHHHQHHHHQSSSTSSSQHRISRRHVQQQHHHQHQQLYMQVDNSEIGMKRHSASPNHRPRASPIRPDHFKSEFRSPQVAAAAQDSSSTASSSSPQ